VLYLARSQQKGKLIRWPLFSGAQEPGDSSQPGFPG
jgi:hypothetical protein